MPWRTLSKWRRNFFFSFSDIVLPPSSRFTRDTLVTFWDCSLGPKRVLNSDGRRTYRVTQHVGCLVLTTALCLFVAFIIW